jgi:hypothetical protein
MLAAGMGEKVMANISRASKEKDESLAEDAAKWIAALKAGNVHIMKGVMNRIDSKREMLAFLETHGFQDCKGRVYR